VAYPGLPSAWWASIVSWSRCTDASAPSTKRIRYAWRQFLRSADDDTDGAARDGTVRSARSTVVTICVPAEKIRFGGKWTRSTMLEDPTCVGGTKLRMFRSDAQEPHPITEPCGDAVGPGAKLGASTRNGDRMPELASRQRLPVTLYSRFGVVSTTIRAGRTRTARARTPTAAVDRDAHNFDDGRGVETTPAACRDR